MINSNQNNKLFKEDASYSLLSSVELIDDKGNFIGKGDIFSKRTIKKATVVDKVETSSEALILSVSQKAKVDFNYMEKLTGKERNTLIKELKGQIFANIENDDLVYISNDEYLTGNIREKIASIDNYIKYCEENNKELLISKEELEYQKEKLKEVLELVSIGNIVELQNIIKEDFWDTSIMLQSNKWAVLYNLMNEEYINKWTIISSYPIAEISNIREFYNILESVPTITSKGIDELNRLKKKYGK